MSEPLVLSECVHNVLYVTKRIFIFDLYEMKISSCFFMDMCLLVVYYMITENGYWGHFENFDKTQLVIPKKSQIYLIYVQERQKKLYFFKLSINFIAMVSCVYL